MSMIAALSDALAGHQLFGEKQRERERERERDLLADAHVVTPAA
jgi:hypothetical protein